LLLIKIKNALLGSQDAKSLIKTFDYPRLGPGMMWERCQDLLEKKGSPVFLNTEVMLVERQGQRITKVLAR
jgi:protoporphyrinogen oxidase